MVLVSSGEARSCADLMSYVTALFEFMDLGHSTEPWWLRDAVESRSSRQTCVTFDGYVHVRIFFAC